MDLAYSGEEALRAYVDDFIEFLKDAAIELEPIAIIGLLVIVRNIAQESLGSGDQDNINEIINTFDSAFKSNDKTKH